MNAGSLDRRSAAVLRMVVHEGAPPREGAGEAPSSFERRWRLLNECAGEALAASEFDAAERYLEQCLLLARAGFARLSREGRPVPAEAVDRMLAIWTLSHVAYADHCLNCEALAAATAVSWQGFDAVAKLLQAGRLDALSRHVALHYLRHLGDVLGELLEASGVSPDACRLALMRAENCACRGES
jgi:hypothetical protein